MSSYRFVMHGEWNMCIGIYHYLIHNSLVLFVYMIMYGQKVSDVHVGCLFYMI